MTETVDSAQAVRAAMSLLRTLRPHAEAVASEAVLPTAALQQTLADLIDAKNANELVARQPDMKRLLTQALDWHEPAQSRATKPVVKAIAQGIIARTDDDQSAYAQTVEMVSYLSLWSPLLEPDRLARVAQHCASTHLAYAPIRYGIGPAGQLRRMLSHYNEARRETLAISLWDQSHAGRWWEHTAGKVRISANPRQTRAYKALAEQRSAIHEQLNAILENDGVPSARLLTDALNTGALTYSTDLAEQVRRTPVPDSHTYHALTEALKNNHDADCRTLAALLPWLYPGDRPESPVSDMVALLLTLHGGPAEFSPATLPAKPNEFSDLYPEVSLETFSYPNEIFKISGTPMPGLRGSDVTIIKNSDVLQHNGDHMGNCTFSKLSQCLNGSLVLVYFSYLDDEYNVSYSLSPHTGVRMQEAKARFNAPVTAQPVLHAIHQLEETLGAAYARALAART